ncbi:MAG: ATP-binding protein [Bacteroidales bacterium]|nr:ATP-binding protein [Bacteroidales bacterium]
MRTSLTTILFLVLFLGNFSIIRSQSYYAPDESPQNKEKSFTLIYTKIHNSERLSELNAGFASYLSSHKIQSRVRTLTVDNTGEGAYYNKLERFKQVLQTPFIRFSTDILVATDSEAHRLIMDADSLIPKRISLISVVYNGSNIQKSDKISTVATQLFFKENFKLGMRLFPQTKNVLVLTDESPYGDIEVDIAREQLGRSIDGVLIHYIRIKKNNFREFINEVKQYPSNTFIILSSWQLDNYGNYKLSISTEPFLTEIEQFPILATQYLSFGSGVIGGYTSSTWDIGYKVAKMANRLDSSGVFHDTLRDYRLLFDYNAMNKWKISSKDLPRGSKFLNKPDSLLENYRIEINFLLALFSILLLSLLIFTLYHIRHRRLTLENEHLAAENLKRKELLDNTLKVMSEGVVSLDRDFNIIEINKKAEEMSGSPGPHIGKNFNEVFNLSQPAGKPSFENFMILALKSGVPQSLLPDFVLKVRNSEYRFITGEIFPVVDTKEKIRQLVFVFRDITEFYRLSRFLRTAMESAMFYTWYYNPSENQFIFDESFKSVAGKNFDETRKLEDFLEMVHPDDKILLKEHHNSTGSNNMEEISSTDFRVLKDGKYEWWQRRSIIQLNREGDSVNTNVYGMDININEYKEREKELIEAKKRAEESDKLKTAFLSNMSHEIRTPLNGIVGFSALLSDNEYTETEKAEFSDIISSNAKMLLGLINDILDLSRIESNSIKFDVREFSLNKQIEEIMSIHQRVVKEGVKITSDLGESDILLVFDRLRNYQILNNLVGNSIKFTEKGEIRIGARVNGEFTEIYVSDTGKGMTNSQLEKVFSRFYKADEFSSGSGLGLPICKALIEFFGGTIRAESSVGKGTTITYSLPHKTLPNNYLSDLHPTTDMNMDNSNTPAGTPQNGATPSILIAEDLESNYILLKIILSKYYKILWAKNGIEAVSLFKSHKPDLVLMDIKMPMMDGLEATKIIRSESSFVPIIAQTANAFEADHREALEAGCNEIITKPIKSTKLLEVVEKFIKRA